MFLNHFIKTLIFILLFCASCFLSMAQYANENDLKKQALKYFEEEDYANAYKAYSTLVSTYPKDPNYNYHLGVCMLYNEKDKKKCFPYLELANKKIEECDKEAKFYYAKAHHINFRFDEAIRLYTQYKDVASSAMLKKLNVDMEIQACKNGKKLLGNLSELVVLEKKQLNESDYFRSYNLSDIGGKLLVKPADFISANDKKKKNKSIIYLPKSNDKLFYSSYGENENKDIYIVKRLPNGEWSKPQEVGIPINTMYDEDYPFLHPNGKVLYFASKGHNSMGGYDIFKSEWNENAKRWGEPKNLEFPINTPNDDILFVTDSLEKTAYFSSSRYSPSGKIDVYKIDVERRPPEFIYITGSMLKKSADQSLESKITVKSIDGEPYNATFQASKTGAYLIKIPNGGKFIFTFETPGMPTQSEDVDVPVNNNLLPYSQVAGYRDKILDVQNFFETNPEDESSYIQNLEVIEQKSQLDVNANEFSKPVNTDSSFYEKTASADGPKGKRLKGSNFENTSSENDANKSTANSKTDITEKKDVNNTDLEKIAFEDANELDQEAKKLKEDADQAFDFLENKKFEASQKNKEATAAKSTAENENDISKKDGLLKKADELSDEAKKLDEQSKLAENIARQLENDALSKKNEAELQKNYAEQLKQVNASKNSAEALKKLEAVQKKIEEFEKNKKATASVSEQLKADISRKEDEIAKVESKAGKIQTELNNLNNELKSLEEELAATKDKDLKANIISQKDELNQEIKAKQDELKTEKDKIAFITNEKEVLKNQSDFANTMLSDMKNLPATDKQNNAAVTTTQNSNSKTDNNSVKTENSTEQNNDTNVASKEVVSETKKESTKDESLEMDEELKELVAQNEIPEKINQLINVDFKNAEAIKFKQEAQRAFKLAEKEKNQTKQHINSIAKNSATPVNTTNTSSSNQLNSSSSSSAASSEKIELSEDDKKKINMEIDRLYMEALTLRRAAFEMTGEEKTKQLAEAKAKDKLAAEKRLDLALKVAKINEDKYNQNEQLLKQYQAETTNKTDPEIIQATNLIAEADKLYKQAMKIEEDAVSETDPAAKSSSYSNVEEKEIEALQKQETALEIFKKKNPDFNSVAENLTNEEVSTTTSNRDDEIEVVRSEIEQKNKDLKESLSQLANAYEKEVSGLITKSKSTDLPKIKKQKQKADSIFAASIFTSNDDEKIQQLLRVNDIYNKALTQLNQSTETLIAKNTSTPNNTSSTNVAKKTDNSTKTTSTQTSTTTSQNSTSKDVKTEDKNVTATTNQVDQSKDVKTEDKNVTATTSQVDQSKDIKTDDKNATAITNQIDKSKVVKTEDKNVAATTSQIDKSKDLKTEDKNVAATTSQVEKSKDIKTEDKNVAATTSQVDQSKDVKTEDKNTIANNSIDTAKSNDIENTSKDESKTTNNQSEKNQTLSTDEVAKNGQSTNSKSDSNTSKNNDKIDENTFTEKTDSDKKLSTATLNEQEVLEIKQTENYITYSKLNKAVKKYDDLTESENQLAKDLLEQSKQYARESEVLLEKSTSIENADEKKIQIAKSNELKNLAAEMKLKADSVSDLAQNTKSFAESKRMEYDAFIEGLDKELVNKIKSVEQNDLLAKNKSNGNTNASKLNSTDEQSSNSVQYSESYINKLNALEKEFERLEAKGKPDVSVEEFEKRNVVINKIIEVINQETSHLNSISTNYDDVKKQELEELVSQLNNKKISLENKISDNLTSIKNIKVKESPIATTNNSTEKIDKNDIQKNDVSSAKQTDSNEDAKQTNSIANNDTTNNSSSSSEVVADKKIANSDANASKQNSNTADISSVNATEKSENTAVKTVVLDSKNKTTNENKNSDNSSVVNNKQNNTSVNNNTSSEKNNETIKETNSSAASNASTTSTAKSNLKGKGFEVMSETAYSDSKPIPVDVKLPEGIIFAVQIGAFRNPIPNNLFKGLSPLRGETTGKGLIRYQAGKFEKFEDANGVKNDLKKMGYRDAFVVVYKDGNQITLPVAIAELKNKGITIQQDDNQSAGITSNANIPPANEIVSKMNEVAINNGNVQTPDELRGNNNAAFVLTTDVTAVQGLFYTVQVGLFSGKVTASKLYNLNPLFTDKIQSNAFRYTAGIYTSIDKVKIDRSKVVDLGIKDAFVSAYLNGQRIKISDAISKINAGEKFVFPTEQPIRFSSSTNDNTIQPIAQNQTNSTNNSVNSTENSINSATNSTTEKGVIYKIQIGAYRKQANKEIRTKFSQIKNLKIDTQQINELFVYSAGSFLDMNTARPALESVKQLGIEDAFICVYRDGKKLYGEEAAKLMGRR